MKSMIDNKYKYLQQLQEAMKKFINQDIIGDTGYITDEVPRLMAEAAFNVLEAVRTTNSHHEKE
jgi:hypothetical protein